MSNDRKPEAECDERAEKPVSFADYEGAWREGMSVEEVNAYMLRMRGYDENDIGAERETR